MQETGADGLARVRRHDRGPPVLVAEEMMATLDTQNAETCLRERGNKFRARDNVEFGSCGDGHPLNAHELQFLLRRTFHFQAQRDGFADALGDLVERARLRVAGGDLGNGSYVIAL